MNKNISNTLLLSLVFSTNTKAHLSTNNIQHEDILQQQKQWTVCNWINSGKGKTHHWSDHLMFIINWIQQKKKKRKKHWKKEYTLKSDHLMCYQWKCNLVLSASYSPKSQNIQLSLLLPFPLSVLNPQCVIYLTDTLNVSKWIKIFLIPCICLLCFHKHQSPIIDDNIHHEHILQKKMDWLQLNKFRKNKNTSLVRSFNVYTELAKTKEESILETECKYKSDHLMCYQ